MATKTGVRPNVRVVRGYKPLMTRQALWGAYELIRPRSLNTRNNYKVAIREIEYVLRYECKLKYMQNYKQKHTKAIYENWKRKGLSDHSLANNMAITRKLLKVFDKQSCILKNKEYGIRRYESRYRDKRWSAGGSGDLAKIKSIDDGSHKYARNFKEALRAERLLGLRKREALLMKPSEQIIFRDGKPYKFIVTRGSKNGRAREIYVTNKPQAEYLTHIWINYKDGLMPAKENYRSMQRGYYYFLDKNGLRDGHGLRQAYANERYATLRKLYEHLGDDRKIREAVYSVLTRELGHNRTTVLKNYLKDYVRV
jgi:phosphoribosyl-AMP cyclohydrolase